ncbi:MAG: PQQ-dependent sugar dehydrogenase [Candidatus Hydrogenedentes bacterium]|nr:PQQ-dependent sugar dehydrogenase [Candidatus Hydrogenedentota bacterium]
MLVWQWSSWVWVLMLVQSTLGAELTLRSEFVAGGFQNPLFLTAAPNDNTRLYVVEQPGRIRIIKNGTLLATPFLNIASKLTFGGERGLLGLAFRPDYA